MFVSSLVSVLSGQHFFPCTIQSSAQRFWVFIKDKDAKSLSGRKDPRQEPLLLEMFDYREQNGSCVLAAQPFTFAIIVDWFFFYFTLCCVELSVWFPLKNAMAQGVYVCVVLCYMYRSHRIKLNCSPMGTALHPPKFLSHKMGVICDLNVFLFQEPDLGPLPVTRSWLRIFKESKYSIVSTFWTGSPDNLPSPVFSSFTQILFLAAAHKLVSSSLTALKCFHLDYKKNVSTRAEGVFFVIFCSFIHPYFRVK